MATKDNGEKMQWHLLPWEAAAEVVKVLMLGAKKYGAHNWRTPPYLKRTDFVDAMRRHQYAIDAGEMYDRESGLLHSAHVVCEGMFQLYYDLKGLFDEPHIPFAAISVGDWVEFLENYNASWKKGDVGRVIATDTTSSRFPLLTVRRRDGSDTVTSKVFPWRLRKVGGPEVVLQAGDRVQFIEDYSPHWRRGDVGTVTDVMVGYSEPVVSVEREGNFRTSVFARRVRKVGEED